MKKIITLLGAVALGLSFSFTQAFAGISNGSGAMAAAVNQANDAVDFVTSLMTNITTQFNANHNIAPHRVRITKQRSGFVRRVYSNRKGVIYIQYKRRDISGILRGVTLKFVPQYNGRALRPRKDVNIENWICTYTSPKTLKNQKQYGVLHNVFMYSNYPLNTCIRKGYRGNNNNGSGGNGSSGSGNFDDDD